MAVETEIKLHLHDGPERAKELLEQHGFRATGPRQLETNQTFDIHGGELTQSGRLLRLRSTDGRWLVTYKGPTQGKGPAQGSVQGARYKSREEVETEVSDGPAFAQILAALGYQPSFAYEKYRTTFKEPTFEAGGENGIVTLDETPIGDFLELEGPESWIDQTASRLGFELVDYIIASYAVLYSEYREAHPTVPRDMEFHAP